MGCGFLLQEIFPNPGIKPGSPALQMDSLTAEPQGKPKNTGVGRLILLLRIFPTQELNQGLLHCRWILYQLSYQGSPQPGIKPRSPTLQAGSLPTEPQGKPKSTGVHSLSLLQRIFPTQESNQGLLHCRQVLYQLSYQGSPQLGEAHNWAVKPCPICRTSSRLNNFI